MAFNHRKLFLPSNSTTCSDILCVYEANDLGYCHQYCALACPSVCPPPPPPPPRTHHISPLVYILVAVLGSAFLLVSYYVVLVKYCSNRNRSRESPPQSEETHEEFLDENHGPVIDHPIWFINTVGLRESIINSITVCKYNRGDGLVEGTECSVCLNEFKEDETLRLLPKCSHAFHVPCIDTWLASHTNCPLCRAPIVSNAAGPPLALTQPNSNNFGAEDEIQAENSVGDGGLGSNQSREGGVCELRVGTEDEVESRLEDGKFEKEGVPSSHSNCGFRVPSDLGDYRVEGENEMQPVRRSVSMDSVSASMICFSMTNILPSEPEGSSSTQLVQGRKSNSGIVPKRAGGNPSIFKLMGNSFTGRSLQRGPISMKRSSSCGVGEGISAKPRYHRCSQQIGVLCLFLHQIHNKAIS